MKRNLSKKIISVFLALILTFSGLGLFRANEAKASGEIGVIHDLDNTVIGTIAVDTSHYGRPVIPVPENYGIGSIAKVGSHYQEGSGKVFLCIEAGLEVAYYMSYVGEYSQNANVAKFIAYAENMNYDRRIKQAVVWKLLGQVNLNETYQKYYDSFINALNANPSSNKFKGAKVYEYHASNQAQSGLQRLITWDFELVPDDQNLQLKKTSKNKNLTDIAKAGYSIKGAEYGVYSSNANAKNNTNILDKLITKEDGLSNILNLQKGIYFVKEIKAPKGFKIDPKMYRVELKDQPVLLEVVDEPKFDPLNLLLKKVNGTKGLEGAEFEVKYYPEILENVEGKNPAKTWVFKTGSNGSMWFNEYTQARGGRIKGDDLFKLDGIPQGLIGTYTFREVKAPEGYILDDTLHISHVTDQGGDHILTYNTPEISNDPRKIIVEKREEGSEELVLTSSAEFKVYLGDEDISGKFEGEKGVYVYKKDLDNKEGKLLTNPETGKLELRELDKGEYRVEEVKAPEGYFLNSNPQKIKLEREETLKFFNEKIPEIKTSAADKKDNNKDLEVNSDVTVTDKISYTNLIPGKEYTVKGKLMDKATNSPLLVDGKEVTAEKKFIAEAREGFVELDFTFNSKALEGKTLVAFEDLFREDRKVATHSDIEDEEQSIYIPKIQTSAWDKKDDDKQITLNEKVTIVDKVSYKNLIVGKEYTIKGVLIDKETGKPLILGNIKKNIDEIEKVESEKTFIAENKDGIIDLEFTFDSKNLEGKTLVVFEDLYREKKKIATHSDIEDKDQTVYLPNMKTSASNKEDGSKKLFNNTRVTVFDKVSYTNLIPGKEYTVKGKLMDKATNSPLFVDGKEVTAEKKFIAEAKEGSVEVEFIFNASELKGKKLVVFEDLLDEKGLLLSHADINDIDQTVIVNENPKTGDNINLIFNMFMSLGAIILMLSLVFLRKETKSIKNKLCLDGAGVFFTSPLSAK